MNACTSFFTNLLTLLIIILGLNNFAYPSDATLSSTAPTITSTAHYTLNDGLVSNNLNEVFIDHKGRMWVNPDVTTAREFRLSFFQFDGTKSIFYDLKPGWHVEGSKSPTWFIMGETQNGFLYGSNRLNNVLFYWHPDTREQYFFALEGKEEKLLNMVADPNGGALVLTTEITNHRALAMETYNVYRLFEGQKKKVGSIQLDFKDDFLPMTPRRFAYPFEVTNDQAWFFHQRKGLVRVDIKSKSLEFLPWTDFEGIPTIRKGRYDIPNISFEWKMAGSEKGKLLLFLGQQNGFFTLHSSNKKIDHNSFMNNLLQKENQSQDMLKVLFARDRKSNLLVTSGYFKPYTFPFDVKDFQAFLMDDGGKWYDYTEILQELNSTTAMDYHPDGNYFSSDFRYELGSTVMYEGMAILDLQPDLKIETLNPDLGYGMRSIVSLDSSVLMVNTETYVMMLDLVDGSWKHLAGKNVTAKGLSAFILHEDKVWVSSNSKESPGLLSFNPANNAIEHYPVDAEFEKFVFLSKKELAFFYDRGQFFDAGQLYKYNIDSKMKRPFTNSNEPFSVGDKVNDIVATNDNTLWVGAQNGLWQIEFFEDTIRDFVQFAATRDMNVICIHQGEEGELWLGTGKSGILIFNHETKDLKQISEVQGLSNNRVVGILKDEDMNRWVATQNGISVINPQGEVLFYLKQEDGLANNKFNRTSQYKLPDGRLVFGGTSGISVLDPQSIHHNIAQKQPYKIYLTELAYYDKKKGGQVVHVGSHDQAIPIHIPANHRYIQLDFAISKLVGLQEQTYRYRLVPKDNVSMMSQVPWIDLGSNSAVNINNLPSGKFFVQVKGVDHRSNAEGELLQLEIIVHEYFYLTWWFYMLAVAISFFIIWIWIRRIKTENKRLETKVSLRTEQIRKDKAIIEQQAAQLHELDQAKTRFFTNISHEFRTPLTVILGMVEQIKDQGDIRRLITKNAKLLLRLVNQILELRKLESTDTATRFIQGDMVEHLWYSIESFHSLAEERGVLINLETPHKELFVDYDSEKLNHIISNLLVNAIKFTPAGGSVTVTLETLKHTETPFYVINISDTGAGIAEDKLTHIFDRFYQVEDEISRVGSGTGIGLALVKELVKLLNGEISVESEPGKGTTFMVQLPLTNQAPLQQESDNTVIPEPFAPETQSAESNKYITTENSELPQLLIVEDNADVTEYMITCLSENYHLLFATDGQEGIDLALEKVPDIIISDVMMPNKDGYELCNTLKTDVRTSHIPIVLLTAKADMDSRISGLERGADAYLVKPFNKRELQLQLQNLLMLRQKMRQRYASLHDLEPTEDESLVQEDKFIVRTRNTILENMTEEDFGVPELCKQLGMSRTQLHNKIKSLTNRSTSHFIRMVRIDKASQLLNESDLNVSQIASEVGIESLTYFSRIFKSETGLAPNQYREQYKLEQ